MENSNQYDELLVRYLGGDLNIEEKVHVENWLAAEPNRKYFDELKAIWNLAQISRSSQQIDTHKEWLHFKQTIGAESEEILLKKVENNNDDVEQVLQAQHKRGLIYRLFIAAAVAASVILVIGLGWKFFNKSGKDVQVAQQSTNDTSQVFVLHHEMNTTGKKRDIHMSDGSLIVLADQSEITYEEPFLQKRDVELTGKAFFKVAKGKPVAFTVVSGDITTTAIGTEFTVTAFEKSEQLSVRLHEGKVVIKPIDKQNVQMKQDVYLLPGQEFIYSSKGILVRFFKPKDGSGKQVKTEEVEPDSLSIPEGVSAPYFMFNNQSLDQVFDNLSAMYNVKIVYHKKDVQNIAFTGKYDKTKSLESILELIAKLNNLTITQKDSAYIISR